MTTAQDIISQFELYVGDTTELSTQEELALLNKIYFKVLDAKPWEFIKKEFSTTTNGTNSVNLPTDFKYFTENYNYTDNSYSTEISSAPKVVYVGTQIFKIINWSDRNRYINTNGYCYVDIANRKLMFTTPQTAGQTVKADYIYIPDKLTLSDSPVFPETYTPVIYHGMCVDDMIIQLFDKARSYSQENQMQYNSYLSSLALYNSNLQNY